jgi:TolB-like protein/Tfp pilus assembly protein PilF
MQPERWQQIDQLLEAVLEHKPEERTTFLAVACGGDESLRREVESLLCADKEAESFIEEPAVTLVAEVLAVQHGRSLVGQCLSHYKILSQLGEGGMGEVYLAEDLKLSRKVAIKFLPQALMADEHARRRLLREAKAAAALDHPNICTIHEVGEDGGCSFIVMQYIEGETLAARIERERLELSEVLVIAIQVTEALQEAHRQGVIHRDIKPQNLMLTARRQVKVLDFGLAKMLPQHVVVSNEAETISQMSTPGAIVGTVPYMSPEQVRGERLDVRSDIFSFGTTLYETVAGRRPFEGATISDVIAALLTTEPPPLRQYCAAAPAELERIAGKCLAKDRQERYQSAEELIADLKALRDGSQVEESAKRRIDAGGARFALRRWPLIVAIAAVLIVGSVWFLNWRRTPTFQPGQIRSLAVLPLENLSGDPGQDYFADGMTETLIAGLSKVEALRVSSLTSVMEYKTPRKPLRDIASELNVDAMIEGTAQRSGELVKINVRLIHAPTERRLWAESYEHDLRNAQALHIQIARDIIKQIQIKPTTQEQMRLASAQPVIPAAYDDYFRARFYSNHDTKAHQETAIKLLERAVATDPNFALAHAKLAMSYIYMFFDLKSEEKQWEEKAFVAVEKARSLDPYLADAYIARGALLWTPAYHFPHEQAVQDFRRALALNPSSDEAHSRLAFVYNHIGAFDQTFQELQKAQMINPTNSGIQLRIAQTLLYQGKYEQALTAFRRIPKNTNWYRGVGIAQSLLHLDRRVEAAVVVEEYLKNFPQDTDTGLYTGVEVLLAALAGEKKKAEDKIRIAIKKGEGLGHFHHIAYDIACAYSVMNKAEPAITWLQAAADDGFPCYPMFENDPYLDNLRKDQRFIALMAKLKEQWEYYRTRL